MIVALHERMLFDLMCCKPLGAFVLCICSSLFCQSIMAGKKIRKLCHQKTKVIVKAPNKSYAHWSWWNMPVGPLLRPRESQRKASPAFDLIQTEQDTSCGSSADINFKFNIWIVKPISLHMFKRFLDMSKSQKTVWARVWSFWSRGAAAGCRLQGQCAPTLRSSQRPPPGWLSDWLSPDRDVTAARYKGSDK